MMKQTDIIVLCLAGGVLYVLCGFIAFGGGDGWRAIAVSAFALLGSWAVAYEVGFKSYLRSGYKRTFVVAFLAPAVLSLIAFMFQLWR